MTRIKQRSNGVIKLQEIFTGPSQWDASIHTLIDGPSAAFMTGGVAAGLLLTLLIIAWFHVKKAHARLRHCEAMIDTRNRELAEATERIANSQKLAAIGAMTASVTHELNNPLTTIFGSTELLLIQKRAIPSDQVDIVKRIRDAAIRMSKIVEMVLTMARMNTSEHVPIAINPLITGTIDLVAERLEADAVQVVTHLAPNLPMARGEPVQLQQAFLNLITNARQAMEGAKRGGTLTISTEAISEEQITIVFANDGPPIPKEHLRQIFEPLFTTKEAGQGTGLGLAICDGIITAHGGRLRMENGVERGVAFIIELRLRRRKKSNMAHCDRAPYQHKFFSPVLTNSRCVNIIDNCNH